MDFEAYKRARLAADPALRREYEALENEFAEKQKELDAEKRSASARTAKRGAFPAPRTR